MKLILKSTTLYLFPAHRKKGKKVRNRGLPKANLGLELTLNEILQILEINDGKVYVISAMSDDDALLLECNHICCMK